MIEERVRSEVLRRLRDGKRVQLEPLKIVEAAGGDGLLALRIALAIHAARDEARALPKAA